MNDNPEPDFAPARRWVDPDPLHVDFDGPSCRSVGCDRELGHIGEHRRDPELPRRRDLGLIWLAFGGMVLIGLIAWAVQR